MLVYAVLWLLWNVAVAADTEPPLATEDSCRRPVMHTFFERLAPDVRFTGMQDEDDDALLEFWRKAWYEAGWEAKVLNLTDAQQHPEYSALKAKLDNIRMDKLGEVLILRWLAMAASGGGWLCDYDVFPLRDELRQAVLAESLPHKGEMTVHVAVAPTLASGSAEAWTWTAKFLVQDAVQHRSVNTDKFTFWADSLGLLNAMRSANETLHIEKTVLGVDKAILDKPFSSEHCDARPFRGKRVLHASYAGLLKSAISPELKLPRHRLSVAKQFLPLWKKACNATVTSCLKTS